MGASFQNWSGSVAFTPAALRLPADEAEIAAVVREARERGLGLRAVGAGHSFTPLAQTEGLLVSLDRWQGLEAVDAPGLTATARAGTRLRRLGALLHSQGLAQLNLGDIDEQSIAGAISTGTHGTGAALGGVATQVTGLRLITAAGELLDCSATREPAIFKAAQVSLGALGIISAVTLRLAPAYRLRYRWRPERLGALLEQLGELRHAHRHVEFFWVPHTDRVMLKTMDATDEQARPRGRLRVAQEYALENGVFWLLCELCRAWPGLSPRVARLMACLIGSGENLDHSHRIFATPRLVRFNELEYSLPVEQLGPALRAIDREIRRRGVAIHFPLECRLAAGDDIPLSPAYGRDSAYVAAHVYRGMPYRDYFAVVEPILQGLGGRPHWGKHHTMGVAELRARYPRWDEFQRVRRGLDPQGLFLNPYLRGIFGE
jgi:FAD-linked oxidoreductase